MSDRADLHPSCAELEDFMLGRLSQRECRRVILHLLPGCALCQEVTAKFWLVGSEPREAQPAEGFRYDGAMERVLVQVGTVHAGLEAERADARRRMVELETLRLARWPACIQADPRCQTWGFCELLLDRAEMARDAGREPEAEFFALLATVLTRRIDTSLHRPAFVEDLTARAWVLVADLRRRAGDLDAAEEGLRRAEAHLVRGAGDRLEKAVLLEGKAALRTAQERPEEAARLLSRVILLYRRTGQWDRVGRILLGLGCLQAAVVRSAVDEAGSAPARRGLAWLLLDLVRGVSERLRR
jgi:tetratricopeptide (TPR) repeat protein